MSHIDGMRPIFHPPGYHLTDCNSSFLHYTVRVVFESLLQQKAVVHDFRTDALFEPELTPHSSDVGPTLVFFNLFCCEVWSWANHRASQLEMIS